MESCVEWWVPQTMGSLWNGLGGETTDIPLHMPMLYHRKLRITPEIPYKTAGGRRFPDGKLISFDVHKVTFSNNYIKNN